MKNIKKQPASAHWGINRHKSGESSYESLHFATQRSASCCSLPRLAAPHGDEGAGHDASAGRAPRVKGDTNPQIPCVWEFNSKAQPLLFALKLTHYLRNWRTMVRITQPLSASRRRADRGLRKQKVRCQQNGRTLGAAYLGGKRQESSARLAIRRRFDERCLLARTKKRRRGRGWRSTVMWLWQRGIRIWSGPWAAHRWETQGSKYLKEQEALKCVNIQRRMQFHSLLLLNYSLAGFWFVWSLQKHFLRTFLRIWQQSIRKIQKVWANFIFLSQRGRSIHV